MKTLTSAFLLASVAWTGLAHAGARLTANTNSIAMFVTEIVPLDGSPLITVKTGAMKFDGYNYGIDRLAPVKDGSALSGSIVPLTPAQVAPRNSYGTGGTGTYRYHNWKWAQMMEDLLAQNGEDPGYDPGYGYDGGGGVTCPGGQLIKPTSSQLLAQGKTYLSSHVGDITGPMVQHMRRYGIPFGVFRYEQTFSVSVNLYSGACSPDSDTRILVWTVTVDQGGHATFGDPILKTPVPKVVHATYFSKAVADGLSPSLAYTNAGFLKYSVLDAGGNPSGTDGLFNVQGVYDAPTASDSEVDVTAAAACAAANDSAGCPAGDLQYPDVRSIMDSSGASTGVLDYVKKITPVYLRVGVDASGTEIFVPDLAVVESRRTLTFNGCGYAVYQNTGSYQIRLDITTNRYLVSSKGETAMVNQSSAKYLQPPVDFSWAARTGPDNWDVIGQTSIINPIDGSMLVPIGDIPQITLSDVEVLGSRPTSTYYDLDANNICDVNNTRIISTSCPAGYSISRDAAGTHSCTAPAVLVPPPAPPALPPATPSYNCPNGQVLTAPGTCSVAPITTYNPW